MCISELMGHTVAYLIAALRYKPEGKVSLQFFINTILPATL
jgi:hypothetical protein